MVRWTADQMPDQTGRTAIITGANSGLGYESALALAKKGAHVIMACRSVSKGEEARAQIVRQHPAASLEVMALDMASLDSIRAFTQAFVSKHVRLNMLCNNAGVMAPPRQETADGFEMQFGVNHLGHFMLTGLLLDTLLNTPNSRVVTVSSSAQYMGRINFDDFQSLNSYSRYGAYCQSKLANVLFAFELQRKLDSRGATTISLAAHPGLAMTNLQTTTMHATGSRLEQLLYPIMLGAMAQSPAAGALPQLYAATAPDVQGGEHFAPHFMGQRGYPVRAKAAKSAYDRAIAARLWEISEELTGMHYESLKRDQRQPAAV